MVQHCLNLSIMDSNFLQKDPNISKINSLNWLSKKGATNTNKWRKKNSVQGKSRLLWSDLILTYFSCISSDHVWSNPIKHDSDQFSLISSNLIMADPIQSSLILTNFPWSPLIMSDPFWSPLIISDSIQYRLILTNCLWSPLIMSDPIWSNLILTNFTILQNTLMRPKAYFWFQRQFCICFIFDIFAGSC